MRYNRRSPTFSENLVPDPVRTPIILPYLQTLLGSIVISASTGAILGVLNVISLTNYAPMAMIIIVTPVGLLAIRNVASAFIVTNIESSITRMRAEYARQTIIYRDTTLDDISPGDPAPSSTIEDRTIINNRTGHRSDEQTYRQDLREFALEIWRQGTTARDQYLQPGHHYRFASGTIMTRALYERMKADLVNSNHAATRPDGGWILVSTPATIRRSIKPL